MMTFGGGYINCSFPLRLALNRGCCLCERGADVFFPAPCEKVDRALWPFCSKFPFVHLGQRLCCVQDTERDSCPGILKWKAEGFEMAERLAPTPQRSVAVFPFPPAFDMPAKALRAAGARLEGSPRVFPLPTPSPGLSPVQKGWHRSIFFPSSLKCLGSYEVAKPSPLKL